MQAGFIYDCTPHFVHLYCLNASRYTGKERDTESGLDYFGARYYGSSIGRWMSPDPSNWGVDFYNPQTWNHYSYVGNNPLSNTDPNGLWLTPTHNSIINNAFPGLSKQERDILQASSKQVDSDQSQAGLYKHGMSSDDNDPYSSTGAYNPTYATNDFIEPTAVPSVNVISFPPCVAVNAATGREPVANR